MFAYSQMIVLSHYKILHIINSLISFSLKLLIQFCVHYTFVVYLHYEGCSKSFEPSCLPLHFWVKKRYSAYLRSVISVLRKFYVICLVIL